MVGGLAGLAAGRHTPQPLSSHAPPLTIPWLAPRLSAVHSNTWPAASSMPNGLPRRQRFPQQRLGMVRRRGCSVTCRRIGYPNESSGRRVRGRPFPTQIRSVDASADRSILTISQRRLARRDGIPKPLDAEPVNGRTPWSRRTHAFSRMDGSIRMSSIPFRTHPEGGGQSHQQRRRTVHW